MSATTLPDRAWLASHLPHRGAMSLLDEVVAWDVERLQARADRHCAPDHPLRRGAQLPVTAAIEYAAQAAAAHGALVDGSGGSGGFLAGVRDVVLHARRLDDIAAPLDIVVERLGGGASGVLYRFDVSAAGRALATGRVTIVLDVARLPVGPAR